MRFGHFLLIVFIFSMLSCKNKIEESVDTGESMSEKYRPAFHFTPDSMWMNDPNGMVYYEGEYHLFYQYYPDSIVWGPMHWGHAVSKDMISWEHLPIALYPDSLGLIFSGSAVIDWNNTSGFGKDGQPAMVAIFTHHNMDKEQAGSDEFQYQSIAYSNDKGRTWSKYAGNPVVPNPGNVRDFRDPKVIWHEGTNKWIMALAVRDKAMFYSSPDLKAWTYESEYGIQGDPRLWECPDLFPISVQEKGETKWILIVSMQSGAPNGGTGTSYFVGDFDGHQFVNSNKDNAQLWLDSGTDNYAMVSWSDIPKTDGRRLMLGWMSNWLYAQKVPTERWRSAMTLPREVQLVITNENMYTLKSGIVTEFSSIIDDSIALDISTLAAKNNTIDLPSNGVCKLDITSKRNERLDILFTSNSNDTLAVGYDPVLNEWYIDRTKAGDSSFYEGFAAKHTAKSQSNSESLALTLVLDHASIELFADDGLTAMTDIFFPKDGFNKMVIVSKNENTHNNKIINIFSLH